MLEVAVFICGAVLMTLELVGSRILAPHLGTSIIVWTSLIGVVLGSLSLGYHLGGKVADRNPNFSTFSHIILMQGVFILLTALLNPFLLNFLRSLSTYNIYLSSLIASILLFAPASIFAGMIAPYAARLKITHIRNSGSTVGTLYAISTFGSIVGTFVGGFFLVSYVGSRNILLVLALILFVLSIIVGKLSQKMIVAITVIFIVVSMLVIYVNKSIDQYKIVDVDTLYNRVMIYIARDAITNKKIKVMQINEDVSSGDFLDSDDLVFTYAKFYRLASHFVPNAKSALMLGGAGYSYPKDFFKNFPGSRMDVIEIDPQVTDLARKYFSLKDSPRLTIYDQDARYILNNSNKKYDVIFGDAFRARTPPYNLTTQEVVRKYYSSLNPGGALIVNVIGSIEGSRGRFLRSEYVTFKSVFPHVYIFPVEQPKNTKVLQNILLIATKSDKRDPLKSSSKELDKYLSNAWKGKLENDGIILTDDYAPVEQYSLGLVL